eukprot:gene11620-14236_t
MGLNILSKKLSSLGFTFGSTVDEYHLDKDKISHNGGNDGTSQNIDVKIVNLWVFFKDKDLSDFDTFTLSPESIDRRRRRSNYPNKDKPFDESDVPVKQEYVDKVLDIDRSIISLRHYSKWLNAVSFRIELDNTNQHYLDQLDEILSKIHSLQFVDHVEEVSQLIKSSIEKSTNFPPSEKLSVFIDSNQSTTVGNLDYGKSFQHLNTIKITDAHQKGYSGKNVTILVIDTGFLKSHESLKNVKIVGEKNFIENITNTEGPIGDKQNDHGTYILSTLAGWKPGSLIGVSYDSNYLLAKTEIVDQEIPVEEDYLISAVEWGELNGASIITCSLGYSEWYKYWELDGSSAISKSLDIAESKGVVSVISSGNNGKNGVSPPADSKKCITVGAVDAYGQVASFSAIGPTADGRMKPEIVAPGILNYAASGQSLTEFSFQSGTSLSAPLVAGTVALILEAHPDWSPTTVKEALIASSSALNTPDNYQGFGIINAMSAINYQPKQCSKTCVDGICVNGECLCSLKNTTSILLCGYTCRSNGGKCSPSNCFKCLDPENFKGKKEGTCGMY